MPPKLDASPLDFLFQFFTSLPMLNLNIYQIIALIFKYFRASLCKVKNKILHFVAFLHFLSFVLLHSPSIWCIFACHFSVWVNRHSFFPPRPFKTVFHVYVLKLQMCTLLLLWGHYHFWLANPPKDLGISGIPSPVLPMSVFRKHLPYLPTFVTPTLAEIPSLTPYAVIKSFLPAYQMLPL